jgi:hypothetical protein
MEAVLDPRPDRHHEEAVEVVDQVERGEQRQNEDGAANHPLRLVLSARRVGRTRTTAQRA